MGMVVFPIKLTSSTIFLDFDFISILASGETISSHLVSADVASGTDANPSAIISGSGSVSGTIVTQGITDGTAGVIYLLTCSIGTSLGNQYILRGYLSVVDTNPYQS